MSWVDDEMETVEFGDLRLNKRAVSTLNSLSSQPTESIPAACHSWEETKAAYRFFDNKKVTSERILQPHIKSTINRIIPQKTVLLIQDTTQLCYSGQKEKSGVGPSKNDHQLALFLHPILAVTPEKIPLGVIDDFSWHRTELQSKTKTKTQASSYNIHAPIEVKESFRWLLGYRKACKIAERCSNTQIVCIGDRESDIFDIYHDAEQRGNQVKSDWLVRADKNRVLLDDEGNRIPKLLHEEMEEVSPVGNITIEVPKRGNKKKRKAQLAVRIKRVKLSPPSSRRGELRLQPIEATLISSSEINPPSNSTPIKWTLITNVYGDNLDDAKKFMTWYLARWQIEVFFHVLKSGCRVENIQLTSETRFKPCIAMYLVIAWRIMFIMHLSRRQPESDCEKFFSPKEWKTIYVVSNKKPPPKKHPTITEIVNLIAGWGGYLGRKHDGPPGPKAIWIGLKRLEDFIHAGQTLNLMQDK